MRPINGGDYRSRLLWDLGRLTVLAARPNTLVYSPFGPHQNDAVATRTVWSSRNIIPLLDPRDWEVSRDERPRLHALRQLFRVSARLSPRVVCVSQHARERLLKLSRAEPGSIAVVPHGADGAGRGSGLDPTSIADLAAGGFILSTSASPRRTAGRAS